MSERMANALVFSSRKGSNCAGHKFAPVPFDSDLSRGLQRELFNQNFKVEGLSSVPNARIRGKIRHEEWPKIAARYRGGETLTEIARSYNCTAPAIRYIVNRVSSRSAKGRKVDRDMPRPLVLPDHASTVAPADARRKSHVASSLQTTGLWDRINSDIATYLAAMDSLATEDSDANYEALLDATDQLLRATARTRLALERVIGNRKKPGQVRRITG